MQVIKLPNAVFVVMQNLIKGKCQMNKNSKMLIGAIIVIVVIVGGYAIFHKSNKPMTSNSTASTTSSKSPVVSNAVLATKTNSSLGSYLTEPNGDALYTYNGDSSGVSNCTGSCLASWPAYQDKGSSTGLPSGVGTIKRTDNGETQYTYNGMPLYTFVGDSNGQVTGNGVSNFSVAKLASAESSQSSATSSSGSATPSATNSSSSNPY
jgi:predicted lipoprotein with Yx(FWY)xxD motif